MAIERHDVGARMSKCVVHGNTVYLAGIVANEPKGKSVTEQTKDILAQIDGFLKTAGFHQVEVTTVAKESTEPFFETLLASAVKN